MWLFQRKSQQMLRRDDALAGRRGYKLDIHGKIMKAFYDRDSKQRQNQCSIWKHGLQELLKTSWLSWPMVQCRRHLRIFLSSIYLHKSKGYVLYCQFINQESWLPAPGMNAHACAPQELAFEQVKMWAAGKWLQIFPPCTKKLHDPLFKTLLPASTFTTHLQHIHSQPNTDLQPTLGCHLLDSCQSN